MINNIFSKHAVLAAILVAGLLCAFAAPSYSKDVDDCILCHRHEGLRVTGADGNVRSFYVDYEHYKGSIHGSANCRRCHTSVTEVPHKKRYKKVNCGVVCHLKSIALKRSFSHSKIYDTFMTSSHGATNEDAPGCLNCHPQNLDKRGAKKSRLEILVECSKCHIDDKTMSKYDIFPGIVQSYENSLHSKVFFLENSSGAICTDCHSTHNILTKDEKTSPMNERNLYKTCAGKEAAVAGCHMATNPDFVYSFNHERVKEAGVATAFKVESTINFVIIALFYFLSIVNIIRIIRE